MDKPLHPVDALARSEKYRIYYRRVVDSAVAACLLTPDPDTEIGHFAFSPYYYQGKELDAELQRNMIKFVNLHPEEAEAYARQKDLRFHGAYREFLESPPEQQLEHLIIVGATHAVWPTGTSFTLTYPWREDGVGLPVRFREDLSDFTTRRIVAELKRNGKLRTPRLFDKS